MLLKIYLVGQFYFTMSENFAQFSYCCTKWGHAISIILQAAFAPVDLR